MHLAALRAAHQMFPKKEKSFVLERDTGIEPVPPAWKASVLPLYESRPDIFYNYQEPKNRSHDFLGPQLSYQKVPALKRDRDLDICRFGYHWNSL